MVIIAYGPKRIKCRVEKAGEKKKEISVYLIDDPFKSTGCQWQFIDGLTHFLFWEIRSTLEMNDVGGGCGGGGVMSTQTSTTAYIVIIFCVCVLCVQFYTFQRQTICSFRFLNKNLWHVRFSRNTKWKDMTTIITKKPETNRSHKNRVLRFECPNSMFLKLLTQRSLDNAFTFFCSLLLLAHSFAQSHTHTQPWHGRKRWRFTFELKCVTCNITRVVIFRSLCLVFDSYFKSILLFFFSFLFLFFPRIHTFIFHHRLPHFHCYLPTNICWSAAFFFFMELLPLLKCEAGASLSELWIVGYYTSVSFWGHLIARARTLNSLWMVFVRFAILVIRAYVVYRVVWCAIKNARI